MNIEDLTPVKFPFKDKKTNQPIGTALIPKGFYFLARIDRKWGNDFAPFQAMVNVSDEENHIILYYNSKSMWNQYLNRLMIQTSKMSGDNPSNFQDFVDPGLYLKNYAECYTDGPVTPLATAELPGSFAQNRQAICDNMVNTLITWEELAPNVKVEMLSAICDPILMKFKGKKKGKDVIILVGCENMGMEYRNAITAAMMMGGGFGLLGALLGGAKKTKKNAGPKIFGHAKEYGTAPDVIRWGYNRLFTCICDAELEQLATEQFLRFAMSFTEDLSMLQKREDEVFQIFQRKLQFSNQMAGQARQMQMIAQQRALETSRMIAQNSAEISAGLMDSWNKKMASESRISRNFSEAARGVNTYQTTDGRTVDVNVTADHVYQNNYGDVYGVSGTAPDQGLLNKLNWREIGR